MRWPPPDTDRNRFLFRLQAVLYGLGAVYFLLFALDTRGLLPWLIGAAFLAASVVVGAGLLLMRAERARTGPGPTPPGSGAPTAPQTVPAPEARPAAEASEPSSA